MDEKKRRFRTDKEVAEILKRYRDKYQIKSGLINKFIKEQLNK